MRAERGTGAERGRAGSPKGGRNEYCDPTQEPKGGRNEYCDPTQYANKVIGLIRNTQGISDEHRQEPQFLEVLANQLSVARSPCRPFEAFDMNHLSRIKLERE